MKLCARSARSSVHLRLQKLCGAHMRAVVTSVPENVLLVRQDQTALHFSVYSFPVQAAQELADNADLKSVSFVELFFSIFFENLKTNQVE